MFKRVGQLILLIVVTGLQAALFLFLFDRVRILWLNHPGLIWALPAVGLLTVAILRKDPQWLPSSATLMDRARSDNPLPSWWVAPFSMGLTLLSQLVGASTGREGTALQFGSGTAGLVGRGADRDFSELLLRCGWAAGFGAVFNTPLAGAIFALEVTGDGRRWRWFPFLMVSSYGATAIRMMLWTHETPYPPMLFFDWSNRLNWWGLVLTIIGAALFARAFIALHRTAHHVFRTLNPWTSVLIGTGSVLALTLMMPDRRYNDLGLTMIFRSFSAESIGPGDLLMKSVFTVLSTTCGLFGGEVTPLLSLGAILGRLVENALNLQSEIFISLGITTVFGAVAGVPFAAGIMAMELFGWQAVGPAVACAWFASGLTGLRRLYDADPIIKPEAKSF